MRQGTTLLWVGLVLVAVQGLAASAAP